MSTAAMSATAATLALRASTARWTFQSATPAPVSMEPCAWRGSGATHASAGQVRNYTGIVQIIIDRIRGQLFLT